MFVLKLCEGASEGCSGEFYGCVGMMCGELNCVWGEEGLVKKTLMKNLLLYSLQVKKESVPSEERK